MQPSPKNARKRVTFGLVGLALLLPWLLIATTHSNTPHTVYLPLVQTDALPVIIPDTTVVLDPATTNHVSISNNGSTFRFDQQTDTLAQVDVGDVIIGDVSINAPSGFLRKVTAIQRVADQVVLHTEEASLTDAIEQGSVQFSQQITPDMVSIIPSNAGVTLDQSHIQASSLSLQIDKVLYDLDKDRTTTYDQVKATGSLALESRLDFTLKIRHSKIEAMRFIQQLEETAAIELDIHVTQELPKLSVPLVTLHLGTRTLFVGPVPIVFTLEIPIHIDLEGNLSAGITTHVTQVASVSAGVHYQNGKMTPIQEFKNTFSYETPTFTTRADVRGSVQFPLTLLLYGVAGPAIDAELYTQFSVTPTSDPLWTLSAGLNVFVQVKVAILSDVLLEYKQDIIRYSKLLATSAKAPSSPTPTRSSQPTPSPIHGLPSPTGVTSSPTTVMPSPTTMMPSPTNVMPSPTSEPTGASNPILVSQGYQQLPTNAGSDYPSISADGRYSAFVSEAHNIVPNDTNGSADIFLHDARTKKTIRLSISSNGMQGNGASSSPSLAADGRYMAFVSQASNLVTSDTNGVEDVFVHDTQTDSTTRISVASSGLQGNARSDSPQISADGRFVAFVSAANNLVPNDTNGDPDIFVHDTQTATTTRVSVASDGAQANWYSYAPSISANGRFIAFESYASNLVPNDTNGYADIFVHDTYTGTTTRVSLSTLGVQANEVSSYPRISGDGRAIAFVSAANTLVANDTNGYADIFVHDTSTGTTVRVSVTSLGTQGNSNSYQPSISADGSRIAFMSYASNLVAQDSNEAEDIFIHTLGTGGTTRVSVGSSGGQGNGFSDYPSISSDGLSVTFVSAATNLISDEGNSFADIFLHDTQTGNTDRVSNGFQSVPSDAASGGDHRLAANGRAVAFSSYATNLVPQDTNAESDVFVYEAQTGITSRVSISSDGIEGNGYSYAPSISGDGRYIAFTSLATNLVPDDTNQQADIFLHDTQTNTTTRISLGPDGTQANAHSQYPGISADGRFIAFSSQASNLVLNDFNGTDTDLFLHDRQLGTTILIPRANNHYVHGAPLLSHDGRYIAVTCTNPFPQVCLYDSQLGSTTLISTAPDGSLGNDHSYLSSMSGDGHFLTYMSYASNIVHSDTYWYRDFIYDTGTGSNAPISPDPEDVRDSASLSFDGRYLAFVSIDPPQDAQGGMDVFVQDRHTGIMTRISVAADGSQGNLTSQAPRISADGRYVLFTSDATNLTPNDTNGFTDIFLYDRAP